MALTTYGQVIIFGHRRFLGARRRRTADGCSAMKKAVATADERFDSKVVPAEYNDRNKAELSAASEHFI